MTSTRSDANEESPGEQGERPPLWLRVLTVASLALLAAVTALVLIERDNEEVTTSTSAATTTTAGASTTPPPATTNPPTTGAPGTTIPRPVDTATAVWPTVASGARYTDPRAAAAGFAAFVGFDDPIVGEFLQGDARSGEVELRPTATGPVTTVFVRQLQDDLWWVLGSATGNIRLDSPGAGDAITTPVRLVGAANSFEGHVSVTIIEDDGAQPIATGYLTGAMGELGPFDSEIGFLRPPGHRFGAILLTTTSAEDGRLWEAAVVRVQFSTSV
jgi:hypothetical protein